MNRLSIETKVLGGFGAALAVLAVMGFLAYQSTQDFVRTSDSIARSREITETLGKIFSVLSQAESGQRGYLFTGDEAFLQPRHGALARLEELVARLKQLTVDYPEQLQRVPEVERRVAERFALLDRVLAARRTRGFEAAQQALRAGPGIAEMRKLETLIEAMEGTERARLEWLARAAQSGVNRTLLTFSLALLSSVAFLFLLFLTIRREIGERRQAEQALRDGEARLRAIIHTAAEGIIVIDEQGRIDRFNPSAERMFGYTEAEVAGKNVSVLMPSPYRERHDEYITRYLKTGEKRVIGAGREVVGQRRDATTFPVELAVSEMRLGARRLFTGIVRDISERKRAEERQARLLQEVESANEELKNFAYVVSHDLKAPLRAIGSLADWIAADNADKFDAEGQEHLRLLLSRVRRMDSLIDGILQYSRVGRLKETRVAVDLNALVREVIDLLQPPENIAVHIDNNLPTVVAERTRLQQVFQNLLGNAIKYMDKPRGEIHIGCTAENGMWQFRVSDNGPGIETRHFDRIFQLFQTLTPRDRVESTGVGLALVKKIVEMYGGRIWLESTVGQGSTFYFTLPRLTAGASIPHGEAS